MVDAFTEKIKGRIFFVCVGVWVRLTSSGRFLGKRTKGIDNAIFLVFYPVEPAEPFAAISEGAFACHLVRTAEGRWEKVPDGVWRPRRRVFRKPAQVPVNDGTEFEILNVHLNPLCTGQRRPFVDQGVPLPFHVLVDLFRLFELHCELRCGEGREHAGPS